jgi:hypothetical protein
MESIDDLLAQVKAEYQEQEQAQQSKQKPLFQEEEFKSPPPVSSTYQPQPSQQNWVSAAEDNLLAQVKAEFEEQARAEELKKQQQLREEQLRKEHRRKREREALTQEATEWLKNLNLRSDEGLWFEEFAYSYPSKLEAAIDYLQALRETHS